MKKLFLYNTGYKLLALVSALVIWAIVANEPELSTFTSVGVQFKDLPEDVEIASEIQESVYLELRGPSGELSSRVSDRSKVVLDLRLVHPGERTFNIGDASIKLPPGVRLVRAIPAQLRFRFERRASRGVRVVPRFLNLPDGYAVASFEVLPPILDITGPESSVDRVHTVSTDTIDLTGVVGQADFRTNAFADDSRVRFTGKSGVTVRVAVAKK